MRRAKFFALASIMVLTDFYVVHPSIRMPVLAMLLLAIHFIVQRGIPRVGLWRGTLLARLLGAALSFCVFMALVDLSRGDSLYDVLVQLFSQGLVAMMLPAFLDAGRPFPLVKWFRRLATFSLTFAVLQAVGLPIVFASLVPNVGVIGSDRVSEILIDTYGRATGATSNTIAFAAHMSMLTLIAYAAYERNRSTTQIGYGLLGLIGILVSQTRAALYGLIPAVILSRLIFAGMRFRTVLRLTPVLAVGLFATWMIQSVSAEFFPYIAKEIDTGDTHRFWTNWYMAVGVLKESPLLGIDPSRAWDVYFRYGDMSITQYRPDMTTPTHHNQIGYYFRYYGLVGLSLLVFVYLRIFQAIKACESTSMRVFLGALFILDFIYSMAHNNKVMTSPLLWIALSMAFLPAEQADRAMTGDSVR